MFKPVVLVILDGWGIGKNDIGNPIAHANLPTIEKLNSSYPSLALQASGISVGLLWGEPGNSEVGHQTMGSGKIIYQSLPRIIMEIQNGEFFKNQAFLKAIDNAKKNKSDLHLMGLIGEGAVHSSMDHLFALMELAKNNEDIKTYLHLFTDGRDSSPEAAAKVFGEIQERLKSMPNIKIASLSGRYFAMDRNNNWDRTEKAYNVMVRGEGEKITDPIKYLKDSYEKKIFDEYMEPAVIIREDGKPEGVIKENDSLIFFNFREDRARQITKAFVLPGFMKFKVEKFRNLEFVAMTQYEEGLPMNIAYFPIAAGETLGKVLSHHDLHQLRIAETEKFAHVTYFFNGGDEMAYTKEERIIVPSVPIDRFDKAPKMSAEKITDTVLEELAKDKYYFILINYANPDIVGHTGNEKAVIEAVETVDKCLDRLIPSVISKGGCLLITADHGNAEEVINNLTGEIDTEHSTNPVPFWFITPDNHLAEPREPIGKNGQGEIKTSGLLGDLAPTVLDLLEIEKPAEMTGESLLPMLK